MNAYFSPQILPACFPGEKANIFGHNCKKNNNNRWADLYLQIFYYFNYVANNDIKIYWWTIIYLCECMSVHQQWDHKKQNEVLDTGDSQYINKAEKANSWSQSPLCAHRQEVTSTHTHTHTDSTYTAFGMAVFGHTWRCGPASTANYSPLM